MSSPPPVAAAVDAAAAAPETATGVAPARPRGLRARFVQRHLHDYNRRAAVWWLLLATSGLLSGAWALVRLSSLPPSDLLAVALGVGFVALAALFPVHIPRTKYSIGVADVFVFSLLALHGAPAAALAAGAEGLVGACRSSKRLTSRVSTPAAATAAMTLCGLGYAALHTLLESAGLPSGTAVVAALCVVSMPYFAGTTLPLLAVVAAKNGQRVSLADWAQQYSWLAAVYLGSAAAAGVLAINARQFGSTVMVLAAAVASAVLALVHHSLRRQEAERRTQEVHLAEARREAELNQQRFLAAFTHAAIGMAIVRPDGSIHRVNQALCSLLAANEPALLGHRFEELLHPGDDQLFVRRVEAMVASGGEPFSMELRCRSATARQLWVSLHCGRFADPSNEANGLIFQLHDITSRRLAEGKLHHIAYHDSLTDLANRNCFNERLEVAVERSRLELSQRFAVMFLDLDRFKIVNDSLGHIAGNLLLREVARRLGDNVRPGDLVARLGGDEFAVLLEHVHDPEDAMALAHRLLAAVSAPVTINGTELTSGASIGITFSDLGYRSCDEVLRDADLAMYAAKADGRRRVMLFDQSMHERIADKLKLEADLRRAIGEGQLSLVYQPLVQLSPHRLSGFEALARWTHPERGSISPAVFIELAEESGHIEALTAWVIDRALEQLAAWHADGDPAGQLDMHVNVSGRDLGNPAFVSLVRAALERHGVPAHCLTLEITETILMERLDVALEALAALREVGCRFSIDDFGTGYSSLAYLSTLPIDSLKIDRSFVIGMDRQAQNIEIVRAVVNLGRTLGKTVIAEGIETVEQLATLKQLGVDIGQGFLLSRPLRADHVPALFATMTPEAA